MYKIWGSLDQSTTKDNQKNELKDLSKIILEQMKKLPPENHISIHLEFICSDVQQYMALL